MSEGTITSIGWIMFMGGGAAFVYGLMWLSNQLTLPQWVGLLLFVGGFAATGLGMEILGDRGIYP